MKWGAVMVSCPERSRDRSETLRDLYASDWRELVRVIIDDGAAPTRLGRIRETWRRALVRAADEPADFVLLLEDDVRFDPQIRAELEEWMPLRAAHGRAAHFFGSLYNNLGDIGVAQKNDAEKWAVGPAEFFWGAQAIVTKPNTARGIVDRWDRSTSIYPDERMARLAESLGAPVVYRRPGLVKHVGVSTWNPIRRVIGYPTG